ncbi:hypothetical protein [Streptomyces plumbiresistens]|uniref:Uncharacterized protein n=1 Tax=Streptomyces plumbiresistens TaxID=511811 RepID=A0ABP7SAZ8_9ACTN
MRPLVSRGLLLPPLLCSALLLVPAGTAAAASDIHGEAADRTAVAWSAPAADAVVERLDALERADRADVIAPLAKAVDSIAATDDARLDPAAAAAYEDTVRTAHTAVQQRLASAAPQAAAAAADPVSDLLASIDAAVDELVKALTSLDLSAVEVSMTELLAPVNELVTEILSEVSEATAVPAVPAVPAMPALPAVELPSLELPAVVLPAAAPQAG